MQTPTHPTMTPDRIAAYRAHLLNHGVLEPAAGLELLDALSSAQHSTRAFNGATATLQTELDRTIYQLTRAREDSIRLAEYLINNYDHSLELRELLDLHDRSLQ